jgi:hypothetical protein
VEYHKHEIQVEMQTIEKHKYELTSDLPVIQVCYLWSNMDKMKANHDVYVCKPTSMQSTRLGELTWSHNYLLAPEVLGRGLQAGVGITELSCGCGDEDRATDILLDSTKRCL